MLILQILFRIRILQSVFHLLWFSQRKHLQPRIQAVFLIGLEMIKILWMFLNYFLYLQRSWIISLSFKMISSFLYISWNLTHTFLSYESSNGSDFWHQFLILRYLLDANFIKTSFKDSNICEPFLMIFNFTWWLIFWDMYVHSLLFDLGRIFMDRFKYLDWKVSLNFLFSSLVQILCDLSLLYY